MLDRPKIAHLILVLCELAGAWFSAALRPKTTCMRLIKVLIHPIFRYVFRAHMTGLYAAQATSRELSQEHFTAEYTLPGCQPCLGVLACTRKVAPRLAVVGRSSLRSHSDCKEELFHHSPSSFVRCCGQQCSDRRVRLFLLLHTPYAPGQAPAPDCKRRAFGSQIENRYS
jgi:hypothetical protein